MNVREEFGWLVSVPQDLKLVAVAAYTLFEEADPDIQLSEDDRRFLNANVDGFFFSFDTLQKALKENDHTALGRWKEEYKDRRFWELLYPFFLQAVEYTSNNPGEAA